MPVAEGAEGAEMDHEDVAYSDEQAPGGADLTGWTAEWDGDNIVVRGPCPVCHGEAYGPTLPDASPPTASALRVDEPPIVTRTVRAECRCGHKHGKDGKKACGRWWHVPVEA